MSKSTRKKKPEYTPKVCGAWIKDTQLGVAVRQLDTAIRLYFNDDDPFSIYALTRNAEEIISMLLRENGKESPWASLLARYQETAGKDECYYEWLKIAIKHRTEKENDIIEMPIQTNELFLYLCVDALNLNWNHVVKTQGAITAFIAWYLGRNPEFAPQDVSQKLMQSVSKDALTLSKKDFYNKYLLAHRYLP